MSDTVPVVDPTTWAPFSTAPGLTITSRDLGRTLRLARIERFEHPTAESPPDVAVFNAAGVPLYFDLAPLLERGGYPRFARCAPELSEGHPLRALFIVDPPAPPPEAA